MEKAKGATDTQCWHCGKIGHVAAECWQKNAEMEQYRARRAKARPKERPQRPVQLR